MNLRKIIGIVILSLSIFVIMGCNKEEKEEMTASNETEKVKFHIGIVTGTVSQAEDEQRGAESMIAKYGDADKGGMIRHLNYPDNYMQEQETTIQQITSLADDPLMKVIVVNQGPPGTTVAFRQVRERRPDIICLVGSNQEDPFMIEEVADWVIGSDSISRGYLMPLAAQKIGAKTFVHVSFPRHMSMELMSLRRRIMEATCKKLGMKFVMETAPDPMSDVGIPGAQQFILEKMPAWVEKYGKDTAFFATNDAQTEPLLKRIAELGAIFIEQDLPSAILGYPGAFGIELKDVAGNWPEILKRVEQSVIDHGGKGRMGTWAYSFGYSTTQALVEYGKQVVEGTMQKRNKADILRAFSIYTPGANWNGSYYVDKNSGQEVDNHLLVYQDTYIFGLGYMGMTDVEVPNVYKLIDEYGTK